MTVICYDGKSLVADKQATLGNTKFAVTKITKKGDWLIGVAGVATDGIKFIDWFLSDISKAKTKKEYPFSEDDSDYQAICVNTKTKEVRYYDDSGNGTPVLVAQSYFAIGSGCQFALTALFLGKTAKEAVEITCELCPDCGMGLDIFEI